MNRTTLVAASLITGLTLVSLSTAALAGTYTVKMKFNDDTGDFYFEPANLKIQPGDTVVWIQDDPDNEHNVAAYPDKIPAGTEPFVSPLTDTLGDTWSQTFTKAGSYFYHCHPHEAAGMRGLVIVGRQSLPEEFRRPKPGEMTHDHGEGGRGAHDAGKMHHGEHMMEDGTMMKDGDMMEHGMDHGEKHGQAQPKQKMKEMKEHMTDMMGHDDDGAQDDGHQHE